MAVTTLELLRMPISNISPRGEITQPERGEEHRGIQRTLQARGKPVFSQDGFGIFSLPANSPHTKGPHDVWWFNDERTPEYIHWEENSSDAIFTGNTRFWQTLQRQLHQKLAHHGDQFRAYSYLGFLLPDDYQNLPPNVYSHGLQSQKCPHWHITESIIPHPADGWLDARNSDDRNNIARGLNLGGEAMVAHFEKTHPALFQGFGTKIKTEQTIGTVSRERTFFAFRDLATAIQASMQLRQNLTAMWIDTAAKIVEEQEVFASVALTRIQSAIPNFAFIIPSVEDRQRAKRKNPEIWVAVGAVTGVPEMLTPGGVHLNRLR